jgi:hypothetical protein
MSPMSTDVDIGKTPPGSPAGKPCWKPRREALPEAPPGWPSGSPPGSPAGSPAGMAPRDGPAGSSAGMARREAPPGRLGPVDPAGRAPSCGPRREGTLLWTSPGGRAIEAPPGGPARRPCVGGSFRAIPEVKRSRSVRGVGSPLRCSERGVRRYTKGAFRVAPLASTIKIMAALTSTGESLCISM